LNIKDEPIFDDRIVKIETHTYNPFANTTFGYSDEIRIPIQQQDLYTLLYESFLYVEGKLTKNRAVEGANVALGNNCVANFCVPLYVLLGFCEDYRRVVINARHELILIRAGNDNNCLTGDPATEPILELLKIQWRMPHVLLSEINKLAMLRALESGRYLSMAFRSATSEIRYKTRNALSSVSVNASCVFKSAFKARGDTCTIMNVEEKHFSLISADKLYANVGKKIVVL
ncbi:hypothetical protein ALC57_18076, partial [Trachymyrmex cornetzi]